jgi:hypothetical protein
MARREIEAFPFLPHEAAILLELALAGVPGSRFVKSKLRSDMPVGSLPDQIHLILLLSVSSLRDYLFDAGLLDVVQRFLLTGSQEEFFWGVDLLRVVLAVPARQRISRLRELDKRELIQALIAYVSIEGVRHESARVFSDILRILWFAVDESGCRGTILESHLPDILRSVETARGLSGQEAQLVNRLLRAIDHYRSILHADSRGVHM